MSQVKKCEKVSCGNLIPFDLPDIFCTLHVREWEDIPPVAMAIGFRNGMKAEIDPEMVRRVNEGLGGFVTGFEEEAMPKTVRVVDVCEACLSKDCPGCGQDEDCCEDRDNYGACRHTEVSDDE